MLRESSVPYSSLPQEEGEQTYVTTRTSGRGESHTNTKSHLVPALVILLLICGVPLMIIAPLALTRDSGRIDTSETLPHISDQTNEDSLSKDNQSTLINALPTPTPQAILIPVIKNTTLKPLIPAPPPTTIPTTTTTTPTTTTTTTTTTTPTTTTTTTTTTPAPITTQPIVILPTAPVLKPAVEEGIEGSGENQTGTTDMPESQKGREGPESGGSEGGDNEGISYTTSQTLSNMMNHLMSKHAWWTVVGLAVVTALALATVIVTITWIIQNRLASRRRRTNLEKVITDLQSRDKIVLLNSEDSDDEA